ncbi:hypothetical protein [Lactococcus cremoris]|nr:hypothetical protein [Lactococcus cremoris]
MTSFGRIELTELSAKLIVHLATDSITPFGRIELTEYHSSMNDKLHSRCS